MCQWPVFAFWIGMLLGACQSAPELPADLAHGSPWRFEKLHLGQEEMRIDPFGTLLGPELKAQEPFERALISWNVDAPRGAGFEVELRVGDGSGWSPWIWLADWGGAGAGPHGRPVASAWGYVDVDAFVAARPLERVQVRFVGLPGKLAVAGELRLQRLDLCLRLARPGNIPGPSFTHQALGPLEVPRLSQFQADPALGARLCSPTSLAMVLGFHGCQTDALGVAARAYDRWHDIYGNWPRSIQSAWSLGVAGYLTCFRSWAPLEEMIQLGRPVILSIAAEPGVLPGAPYAQTAGHLLVVIGFDATGNVIVNDPAASSRAEVRRVYARVALGRAWFGHGGVAYVLAPLENSR